MKKEESPAIKAIQLTGRDNKATWKSKENGTILMIDMTDEHIQAALGTVQTRQLRNVHMLNMDFRLEQELRETAKQRGLVLRDYDEAVDNSFSKEFKMYKVFLSQLGTYIKRKIHECKRESKEEIRH